MLRSLKKNHTYVYVLVHTHTHTARSTKVARSTLGQGKHKDGRLGHRMTLKGLDSWPWTPYSLSGFLRQRKRTSNKEDIWSCPGEHGLDSERCYIEWILREERILLLEGAGEMVDHTGGWAWKNSKSSALLLQWCSVKVWAFQLFIEIMNSCSSDGSSCHDLKTS